MVNSLAGSTKNGKGSLSRRRRLFQVRWKPFSERLSWSCHTTRRQCQARQTDHVVPESWQRHEQRRQGTRRRTIQRTPKGSKSAKGPHKRQNAEIGLSSLENPKTVRCEESSQKTQENPQTYHTDNSSIDKSSLFDDGWSYDEWNDDGSSVGGHEGWN